MRIEIDGREYEVASYSDAYNDGSRRATLRLVKQQPKYEIDSSYVEPHITVYPKGCTPNQVDLIKEAVEALMEYLMVEGDIFAAQQLKLERAIKKARSMRENN